MAYNVYFLPAEGLAVVLDMISGHLQKKKKKEENYIY